MGGLLQFALNYHTEGAAVWELSFLDARRLIPHLEVT